ncbi:oxidoreductase, partial [Streptomyces sp. T-3]|nr:oxidoreductase [Streptomyces sp. T-3]
MGNTSSQSPASKQWRKRFRVSAGVCGAALVATALAGPAQARGTSVGESASASGGTYKIGELAGVAASGSTGKPGWQLKPSGVEVRFRGLAAVSRSTAWVAGSKGTVLRTADGGKSWRNVSPPGAETLEFRDIEAFDGRRAVVLAIGEGEASRVFRTEDGGATWTESFRNTDPKAFYDCITFFDPRHGLALSDPVDGKYRILSTSDGGRSWKVLPNAGMPAAQEGEASFAASGQCLVSTGSKDVWLATGGAARARVLHSGDRGLTWTATDSPIPAGDP